MSKKAFKMAITRALSTVVPCVTVLLAAQAPALAFSGEDPLYGKPWHHAQITHEAAAKVGFDSIPNWNEEHTANDRAAEVLAWHADYIDSYLYNPIWWARGGLDRYKVSLSTYDELAKLHFDDLFSGDHVRRVWPRYLTGTVAGLLWAKEHDDVSAARNILAVSLHAIQDFYSHSSWVDVPERRTVTWFSMPAAERAKQTIYTGAYEKPEQLGIKHHGKIAPMCSILSQGGISGFMNMGCSGISPLSNSSMCQQWKECKEGKTLTGVQVAGVPIPSNIIYLSPPGIALDNHWIAAIGVKQRGLTDVTSDQIFDIARKLALDSSVQWLQILEWRMTTVGAADFWKRVKTEKPETSPKDTRYNEYEQYNRFPYTFLSAGTYPPRLDKPEEEYYLRVRLKTSSDANAGTNSDIYLRAAGSKGFLLDYMPGANPVIAYNDFEAGDDQVYTVGPFSSLPSSLEFENRSATGGEVLKALGRSFVDALDTIVTGAGDFLLSIVGGHADLMGRARKVWTTQDLA
ncbi:MAG: hypothetical protein M3347_05415, partial [Armatimonadota bacterium]|nr:hypothetical protein [Armatimonadota bacterium]